MGREQYAKKQQNLKLTLYLTLSLKYKLDGNNCLFYFFISNLMIAEYNLQRIKCNLKWFIQEDIWFQMKKRKFRAYFKTLIMTLYWKVNNFFYKRCFSVRQTLLLKMNSTTAKTTAKNLRQFFILEQILVFA